MRHYPARRADLERAVERAARKLDSETLIQGEQRLADRLQDCLTERFLVHFANLLYRPLGAVTHRRSSNVSAGHGGG